MRRRNVLLVGGATVAGGLAAVVATWPGWLKRAFSEGATTHGGEPIRPEFGTPCQGAMKKTTDVSPGPKLTTTQTLGEAAARARAEQKKMLVLVIPRQPPPGAPAEKIGEVFHKTYERGRLLGEYLNHGSDAELAPLASAVVVCAQIPDLQETFGVSIPGEPLLVVLDPRQTPVSTQELDGTFEALPQVWNDQVENNKVEQTINAHIKMVAGLVERGLGGVPAEQVAQQARQVRDTLVKKAPQGGRWGNSNGCGVSYEEPKENELNVAACGMGFVPKRSARFLDFLTKKPA